MQIVGARLTDIQPHVLCNQMSSIRHMRFAIFKWGVTTGLISGTLNRKFKFLTMNRFACCYDFSLKPLASCAPIKRPGGVLNDAWRFTGWERGIVAAFLIIRFFYINKTSIMFYFFFYFEIYDMLVTSINLSPTLITYEICSDNNKKALAVFNNLMSVNNSQGNMLKSNVFDIHNLSDDIFKSEKYTKEGDYSHAGEHQGHFVKLAGEYLDRNISYISSKKADEIKNTLSQISINLDSQELPDTPAANIVNRCIEANNSHIKFKSIIDEMGIENIRDSAMYKSIDSGYRTLINEIEKNNPLKTIVYAKILSSELNSLRSLTGKQLILDSIREIRKNIDDITKGVCNELDMNSTNKNVAMTHPPAKSFRVQDNRRHAIYYDKNITMPVIIDKAISETIKNPPPSDSFASDIAHHASDFLKKFDPLIDMINGLKGEVSKYHLQSLSRQINTYATYLERSAKEGDSFNITINFEVLHSLAIDFFSEVDLDPNSKEVTATLSQLEKIKSLLPKY